jgi:hypothetical protein
MVTGRRREGGLRDGDRAAPPTLKGGDRGALRTGASYGVGPKVGGSKREGACAPSSALAPGINRKRNQFHLGRVLIAARAGNV